MLALTAANESTDCAYNIDPTYGFQIIGMAELRVRVPARLAQCAGQNALVLLMSSLIVSVI